MKNKHIGSDFDEFLKENDLLNEAEKIAMKRIKIYKQQKRPVDSGPIFKDKPGDTGPGT